MRFSAVDAISPAFEHTKRQLFQPFRIGQWIRLALVGLLAGELSSSGCKTNNFSNLRHPGTEHLSVPGLSGIDPMLIAGLIAVVVFAAFVLGILLMYISSVMRFILFDSVLAKECRIREGWSLRQGPGMRYFLWKILYALGMFGGLIVLVGIPAAFAFGMGWLSDPKQHVAPLVLCGIALVLAVLAFVIAMAVIFVLTKDFVVPQMALENIGALEGWSRLWTTKPRPKGQLRRLRRNEDRAGDRGGHHLWHFGFHHRAHHFDSSGGCGGRRCSGRKSGRAGLDRGHDHARGSGGMRAAGHISFCDGPDLRARDRFLSRILDIFLRCALSEAEQCALPRTTCAASSAGHASSITAHARTGRIRLAFLEFLPFQAK